SVDTTTRRPAASHSRATLVVLSMLLKPASAFEIRSKFSLATVFAAFGRSRPAGCAPALEAWPAR
ncbi:MAG: hypothetical protein ACR2N5_08300, partial [Solirubrobacterales bacterium]